MEFKSWFKEHEKLDHQTVMMIYKMYGIEYYCWALEQVKNGFEINTVLIALKEAFARGIDVTKSDDLYSLEVYMNALDKLKQEEDQ